MWANWAMRIESPINSSRWPNGSCDPTPGQAAPYMLLSDGYVQRAKNAYQEDDKPTSERWERKALDAAMHAATLDPENDEARGLVKNRRTRLQKLASGQ
jgi:hypothetical protein